MLAWAYWKERVHQRELRSHALILVGFAMLFELPFMEEDYEGGVNRGPDPRSRVRVAVAGSRARRGGLIDLPQRPHSASGHSSSRRSSSIPLPSSHVHRTQSEVQLSLDQEVAEQREVSMFYRLVNGIRDRQAEQMASSERSVASIMQTRYRDLGTEDDPISSHISPDNASHYWQLPTCMPFTEADHEAPCSMEEEAEEWSISGFDNQDSAAATIAAALPPASSHENDTDSDEIFDLDM